MTLPTTTSRTLKLVIVMVVWASRTATAALLDEPIQPIPLTLKQDPARAEIGRLLFRDTRLSGNGRVSCASCTDLGMVGVDGDANAISAPEKAGYAKFKQYGCVACHQGVNVGGNMFQKFGVMGNYLEKRGNPTQADLGRYLVTKVESDKYVFKVPSLRNVALT